MKELVLRGTPVPGAGAEVGTGCSWVEAQGCVGAGVGTRCAGSQSRAHGMPQPALRSLPTAGQEHIGNK